MNNYKMTSGEQVWYYVINIFTLGWLYFTKTAVKKALTEVDYTRYTNTPQ